MTKKCLFCAADDVSDDDWKMLVETDTRKIKRRWIPRVWAYIYSGELITGIEFGDSEEIDVATRRIKLNYCPMCGRDLTVYRG